MANPHDNEKKIWPMEAIYVKEECFDSLNELPSSLERDIKPTISLPLGEPSIKDDPDLPSLNPCYNESVVCKDEDFKIKEELVEECDIDCVKEQIDVSPSTFAEVESNGGASTDKNLDIEGKEEAVVDAGPEKKTFECQHCSKKLSQKKHLKSHLLMHTGEKRHECQICFRKYASTGQLKRHILTHVEGKLHKCNICEKEFSMNDYLQKHILTHSQEKPHECNICHRKFGQKGDLQRHLSAHTGEKPYKCHHCNRKFSRKGHLQSHIIGEKSHECKCCGKTFCLKRDLHLHTLTHSRE